MTCHRKASAQLHRMALRCSRLSPSPPKVGRQKKKICPLTFNRIISIVMDSVGDGYLLLYDRRIISASRRKQLLVKVHPGHPEIVRMKRILRQSY
ncbi:hypothetical protein ElyMa_000926200 [Elysia marginata]|uniref:Uncharacterized protein n=1 Tax=Elysia marginata TaxID=1093978 RepID=A0AAV4H937_9GAST|nr:hypothetical protein ElyMa_000926200 [Elysia marginata]